MKTRARNTLSLALVLALAAVGSALRPAGAATFVPTSPLAVSRCWHSATLLPTGNILVAGGESRWSEVYDPAAGTWGSGGNLVTARHAHTATLLPNGTVLVAGGNNNVTGTLSSAELYDPGSGKWTETGPLSDARWLHTATLLPNGKVLVVGGSYNDGSDRFLSSAELYDPATGTWTATGALGTGRSGHTATLLPNGTVLVVGGYYNDGSEHALASAELYDPASGKWTTTGALSDARELHTATLLPDGKVLVAGGYYYEDGDRFLSSAELYDPATGEWTITGALSDARINHTATLLPDGTVLVAGGYYYDGSDHSLSSAELYAPATGSWTATGTLNAARELHTATLLINGRVLVAGGYDYGGSNYSFPNAEIYDQPSGTWTETGAMSDARCWHTATLLPNGTVLVAGGRCGAVPGTTFLYGAELYDPASGAWSVTGALGTARSAHTATMLLNGTVLVAGGNQSESITPLSSAELYNPATGSWTATAPLRTARLVHTATLLPDGKVLVAGGKSYGNSGLSSAELFDPAAGTWTVTGALRGGRYAHTASLLPNGMVLVAGGSSGSGYVSSAELYDPVNGTWKQTGAMNSARGYYTATLLPNGKVLVAGGFLVSADLSAELYDPATGMWSVTGALGTARVAHTATMLLNGTVLVAGGSERTAELYDPASGTWTLTGALSTERWYYAATLLPNGKVLVAGGNMGSTLSSAELYEPDSDGAAPSMTVLCQANQIMSFYWTGAGTLEQTASLTPPDWQPAPIQDNPHTLSTTDPMKFFRVKTE